MSEETPRFDQSKIAGAIAAIDIGQLTPIIQKAADDFYERVLNTTEEYLRDNLEYNLKAHLAMLERENQRMRKELYDIDQIVGPCWGAPEKRIEALRSLDRARAELTALKYQIAFAPAARTQEPPKC